MKKTIYYIPIEPLEERYTEQWYRNIPIEFERKGYDVITIDGTPLASTVITGTFLDINSTVYYKAEQLKRISKMFFEKRIRNGSIFFIGDLEFWGIEAIRYMADLQNIDVKIYGFLHAASYTKGDYMEKCADYGKHFELGWLKMCDGVFVGSNYHKRAILERRLTYDGGRVRGDIYNKIHVTGNPIFKNDFKTVLGERIPKKNQIIISNRFDWEKRPNLSLDFAYLLKKQFGDWLNIIVTTSRPKFKSNKKWLVEYARELKKDGIIDIYWGLTKNDYYRLLKESKIMLTNTIEENFGYCVIEACVFNTYPLCPNDFSHPELLQKDKRLLFDDEDEIKEKVGNLLFDNFEVTGYAYRFFDSIKRMVEVMKKPDYPRYIR